MDIYGEPPRLDAYSESTEATCPSRARRTPSRTHLTPRAPRILSIAIPSHMESTASQNDTHVAHEPLHLASQPSATPLEKVKLRMDMDPPASVTTMTADLRDLSRARPHPAPSLSILSPVRAAMQQLDYRVAELEILQTNLAPFPITNPLPQNFNCIRRYSSSLTNPSIPNCISPT